MLLFFLKIISTGLNSLPLSVRMLLGDTIGYIWFVVIRFRRRVVVQNLKLAFGASLSDREINKLALRNFQHYGKMLLEILQSVTWTLEDYRKYVTVSGAENIRPYLEKGRPGFFLVSHLGNWELAPPAVTAQGIPVDIVVREARQETIRRVQKWYRGRNFQTHGESGTVQDIFKSFTEGRCVGFVFDQFMGPPIGLPVKFFGHQAGTVVSLALLTDKRNIPVFPAFNFRDEKGHLHVILEPALTFEGLSEDREERLFQKTQRFNDILEERIRRFPEQWLWLHRRWKPYVGEPRWSLKKLATAASVCLLFWFIGCASTDGGHAKTGIQMPPDPEITVPHFSATDAKSEVGEPPKPVEVEMEVEKKDEQEVKPTTEESKQEAAEPAAKVAKKKRKTKVEQTSSSFSSIPKDRIPFEIGEKLEIDLGWAALPAGRVTIEVQDGSNFKGRKTFRLLGNVVSSKLVDAIYHVDNVAESFVDQDGLIPYKFSLHMVESAQKKETSVLFDHVNKKAFYRAKRISEKWGNEDANREDTLVPQARDLFSAVYFARAMDYTLKRKRSFVVYENGQNWQVELLPVANELITTKVGAFQCWKIKLTVKLNNVLSPTGDVYMWLSDDSKKYLVKFEAKIKIGALVGNLVSVRERL